MIFFTWKNKPVVVYKIHGVPAHPSSSGKVWTENKQLTDDSHSRWDGVLSAPMERWGTTSMKQKPLLFLYVLLGAERHGCFCSEYFLRWRSPFGVPREVPGLHLVSNCDWKGSLHLMGVLNSWLFSLGQGDREIGDASEVGARREGKIDWGFMRLQNT